MRNIFYPIFYCFPTVCNQNLKIMQGEVPALIEKNKKKLKAYLQISKKQKEVGQKFCAIFFLMFVHKKHWF